MSRLQNSFRTLPDSKNSPIEPQHDKNDPKIKSKSNARIEGIIKMKVVQLYEWTPKQFLNPTLNPKIAH